VKRLKENRWGVEVETPTYDLTVFHVFCGKLSLKIYSKGECVLRIEVMIHNASATPYRRQLADFPKTVACLLLNGKLGISPMSVKRAKEKIRQITRRNRGVSLVQVIVELNLFLIGWLNYYRYAACRFEPPMPGRVDSAQTALLSSQTTQARQVGCGFPPPARIARPPGSSYWLFGERLVAFIQLSPSQESPVERMVLSTDSFHWSHGMMRCDTEETAVYGKYVRWCGRTGPRGPSYPIVWRLAICATK